MYLCKNKFLNILLLVVLPCAGGILLYSMWSMRFFRF